MRKILARAIAISIALVSGISVAPTAALANSGTPEITGCYRADPSDAFKTYAQADVDATKISSSGNQVTATINGYGTAYDCGPAGRPKLTPKIALELTIRIEGKRLACDGTVVCNRERSESIITLRHICTTTSDCRISLANKTFAPAGDGRITQISSKLRLEGGGHLAFSSISLL